MVDVKNKSAAVGDNERFEELGRGCYAYSADGCSNTGVIIGERGVLIVDGQASPELAEKVLSKIRDITDKPVKQLVLTHFHADHSLGSPAFEPGEIVASDLTRRMMDTRGKEEIRLSRERSAELFAGLPANGEVVEPTMTIASSMTIDLGGLDVRLMHLGRGHTMGDIVVWVPASSVIFSGDLVQKSAAPYCGDAHLADWPRALDRISAFRPNALMPGRGRSALGAQAVATAIETTRDFVTTLRDAAAACVDQGLGLKDTFHAVKDALVPQFGQREDFDFHLPLNVARAYDEALGLDQPQVWTRERHADLRDALKGALAAGEPEEETVAPVEEAAPEAEPATENSTSVAPADSEGTELVSDNDFAASLSQAPEEEESGDDEPFDFSADDAVEIGSDEETSASENEESGAEGEKVLEETR
ncbi:MBL fold metallo-hydrolase [Roseibium salinum]|uniref:MBL fold metallo-hydrolase n=1 Tax=Roseibium salinum TaxID=1604349 RepID=A0ABT3R2B1_9HYPH|nr:MBL fold metallo-hydrolase [Roseibium sp. DSM 29163]MCX2723218.1 MBL fold metallo-hydrolase [Roseibium sp. DSM 29163]